MALVNVKQSITTQEPSQITLDPRQDMVWFPDFDAARAAVNDYLDTLPSTTETTEQHTKTQYNRTLDRFQEWLGNDIPSEERVAQYMADLRRNKKSVQACNTYLAPIKLFCSMLAKQPIYPQTNAQYTVDDRFALSEIRQAVTNVQTMKQLKKERKSNLAGIDNPKHNRRPYEQMLQILEHVKTDDRQLVQKRDYALWVLMLNSAIRISEAARCTLENFVRFSDDTFLLVDLQGKGGNFDPVPVPYYVYDIFKGWVETFNNHLPKHDIRQIPNHQAPWVPLTRIGNPFSYVRPSMSRHSLADIIVKRSDAAGFPMNPHDTRRSAAAYLRHIGMEHSEIQKVTRHMSLDMVTKYIGTEQKWDEVNHFLKTGKRIA